MFTGIIEAVGRIHRLDRTGTSGPAQGDRAGTIGEGGRMEICFESEKGRRLAPGNSIAVNGCCLTVVEATSDGFAADLSPETLRRTSFAELSAGALVNLERPLAAGGELGGHFVLGHVDGTGRLERMDREGGGAWLAVRLPAELERYVAVKGSLAVDGISLTVARSGGGLAEFAVIPYTLEHTNLAEKKVSEAVNLECDVLARYLERLLDARGERQASSLTLEQLIAQGF
ncbi:MAG TPA: riboflavin synthase [Candidatus Acidoferrales bacterium]|nr:riboflavin synthase [Candidatus Acidoferrales bacterium]